jgi:hypothetical protein
MSKINNFSRAGWVIVGLVAAMLLVPTMAVAATVAYNGIEGTNGTTTTQNKAQVTSAGQLLTTGASPQSYEEYTAYIDGAAGDNNGQDCEEVVAVPSGKAFVAQQIEVDVFEANSPSGYSSPFGPGYYSNSSFGLYADSSSEAGACIGLIATGEAPGNTEGNVAIPLVPGYVIPSGYHLDAGGYGLTGQVYVTGYLVPSADAPSVPQVSRSATLGMRQRLFAHLPLSKH